MPSIHRKQLEFLRGQHQDAADKSMGYARDNKFVATAIAKTMKQAHEQIVQTLDEVLLIPVQVGKEMVRWRHEY